VATAVKKEDGRSGAKQGKEAEPKAAQRNGTVQGGEVRRSHQAHEVLMLWRRLVPVGVRTQQFPGWCFLLESVLLVFIFWFRLLSNMVEGVVLCQRAPGGPFVRRN